ncbi:bifunctional proline dehydrogenase/L-glutamate gamma-semialdehyde dehydrogenase PutA [Maricurvus nonylphenolicus]|uniref:bifunctional proline dehydrogenase/L-glutamate gamma-semialdehyde dehydrogenase PutA n=1 Tax=Maricurvus nonylphenolicus TaxID=1008307 RepID=UPI0036F19AC1
MLTHQPFPAIDAFTQAFRDTYRQDEDVVIESLLPQAKLAATVRARAWYRARELVVGIRRAQTGKGGVDALLNEFSLSTEEGIVLMCLAEALLRVPDKETTDSLIRDKLTQGDWSSHLGHSDSLFVNASAWGLLLTGKVVSYNDSQQQQIGLLKKTVNRFGEPVIRSAVRYAMQIMGTQFVMGKTIGSALKRAEAQEGRGYRYSYDMLGEGARTQAAADRYFQSYLDAIHSIGKAAKGRGPMESPGISVKLSAIHPRYEFSHRERVLNELVPQLKALALVAKQYDIGFTVDAEEADRLELSLEIIGAVFADQDLDGWNGFGLAIQAYQKRALLVVDWARDLSKQVGRKMMVRLVKGAYWDSEIKWSQEAGLADYPVFTRKPSTDVSYQACAKALLAAREYLYPQFATHNAYTVASILEMDDGHLNPVREGYEFQRLHGMGEALYDQVLEKELVSCRIYAPVGEHADLLAYLVRRLLENGANSSFVNNIVDETIPVESLLQDPVEQVESWGQKRNLSIPKPLDILSKSKLETGQRQNSMGLELSDVNTVTALKASMEQWWQSFIKSDSGSTDVVKDAVKVMNPANHQEQVGNIQFVNEEDIEASISRAEKAFTTWSVTPVVERAALLRRLATVLEDKHACLMALCTKEAGKTIADGVAEVREAVDFCRYYADRAEELMADESLQARGVILCVSPWNFPLAIFLGQVAAALVTGNTVVAKPAEQTSLIAIETVKLMKSCGFPESVVELVVAPGKPVGEKLVPDSRIQGVMFTGSTDTGRWLSKTLANRADVGIPLIAETGGQNAMIVDSTALPEQVVDDVIQSGFQSAGQRCSALRVLFLQDDVADKIITMIKGAMDELHIGDPALLTTDVGPVIDAKALARLHSHVDDLAALPGKASLLHKLEIPGSCTSGNFFVPHLFELSELSVLKQEVFGPVVHVIRFKAGQIDAVIDQINATGFGLTLGVHSRIEGVCNRVADKAQVGNVYVNRNMIGAVVGVQPFGGCGLSGTGPKAGGPHYLSRLVTCGESVEAPREKVFKPGIASANLQSNEIRSVQYQWAALSLEKRELIMRSFVSCLSKDVLSKIPSSVSDVINWLQPQIDTLMSRIDQDQILPGPTGESNCLKGRARGVLVALLADEDNFEVNVKRVLIALMAGNAVVWLVAEQHQAMAETIVSHLRKAGVYESVLILKSIDCAGDLLASEIIDGALINRGAVCAHWAQLMLAEREGALLPLITETRPELLLPRLLQEKTVTVDTTAAGGNASLMTMGA